MTAESICSICKNHHENRLHLAKEMLLGTRIEFKYLECFACGFLELINPPTNMAQFYPSEYYSYSKTASLKLQVKRARNQYQVGIKNLLGMIFFRIFGPSPILTYFQRSGVILNGAKILDVGCGVGNLLREFLGCNFSRIVGIDPFMREEHSELELVLKKTALDEMNEKFDVIMFNHSFEHFLDPKSALEKAANLLEPHGKIIIRIPVASSWAWKHYGVNWVQLDAPRHISLFTEKSLSILANQCGLEIFGKEFDSFGFQIWGSELYKRGVPLAAPENKGINPEFEYFTKAELKIFARKSAELNASGEGDQAVFLLKHHLA